MKKVFILFCFLFFIMPFSTFGANVAINERTELDAAPAENDILAIYDSSASAGKRITVLNLLGALESALTSFSISTSNLPTIPTSLGGAGTNLSSTTGLMGLSSGTYVDVDTITELISACNMGDYLSTMAGASVDDEATFKAAVNLEAGTDVQAYSAALASIAGLTEADISILECTADNTYAVVTAGGGDYFLSSNTGGTALEFKSAASTLSTIGAQSSDGTLTALAALTITDYSIIQGTGSDSFSVLQSGGINYILGSNSDNSALEFKTPANVLTQIGGQPVAAGLTSISGLTETNGGMLYGTADDTYAWLAAGAEGTLLMGNGSSAPSWLAAGTAGEIFVAQGAADPLWLTAGTSGYLLVAAGASDPVWTAPTGSGSPMCGTSPTITTSLLMANGSDLKLSTTTSAHEWSIQLYDNDDTTWRDILNFANGDTCTTTAYQTWDFSDAICTFGALNSSTIADAQTLTFDESAADPDDCDVRLSAADGVLTILGVNGANNESLTIDVDQTSNTIILGTGTGVTEINTGAINFASTGTIAGRVPWGSDITENTALNTTALHGKMYLVTAACTVTLDKVTDCGFGAVVGIFVRDGSETVTIEVDDADKINLDGTALDAGDTIDSPGDAGDFIYLISTTDTDGSGTDGWLNLGTRGTWTDAGAT